ncbi:dihydroflavonol-4-reductase [Mycobacterium parmense]|uniref:Dihydroflavonol-4-reductase n=1 Tax=Mycobacterium parmense TaxID=185642 RepID=A0A7I7Z0Q2_9MYCO|nr:dihydroflavonol-4-reductase [Mycobacterium parmense]
MGCAMGDERVLVTGGSGFVGSHCVFALLNAGYRVRTTVRSAQREADVRNMVERAGATPGDSLTFAVADLTSDAGWPEAMDGSTFVLHVASPYPADEPPDEDEVILPARDGTLRVLRAARDAGVKRVVLTSSFVAIGCGHGNVEREFTEDDWTDLDGEGITAYVKSKVLAERAAWDFAENEAGRTELSVVNPTATFGPTLSDDISASVAPILTLLMAGEEPVSMANLRFSVADVRDVADVHLRAMTHPAAAGQRFIACCDGGPITMRQAAQILRAWVGVDSVTASPVLGGTARPSNRKAKAVLRFTPRAIEEVLLSTAGSLVRLGLVPTA